MSTDRQILKSIEHLKDEYIRVTNGDKPTHIIMHSKIFDVLSADIGFYGPDLKINLDTGQIYVLGLAVIRTRDLPFPLLVPIQLEPIT